MPLIMLSRQQIFHIEGLSVRDGKMLQVKIDPAGLFLGGIEIDRDKDEVAGCHLAVAEDMRTVGWMEVQRAITLQGGIFSPYLVEAGDERSERVPGGAIPSADLVLFAMEVLFAAGPQRE